MESHPPGTPKRFLSRREASRYLTEKFFPVAISTLAKLASIGGGPRFRKAGAAVIYEASVLDEWATSKISNEFENTTKLPIVLDKPRGRPCKPPAAPLSRESAL